MFETSRHSKMTGTLGEVHCKSYDSQNNQQHHDNKIINSYEQNILVAYFAKCCFVGNTSTQTNLPSAKYLYTYTLVLNILIFLACVTIHFANNDQQSLLKCKPKWACIIKSRLPCNTTTSGQVVTPTLSNNSKLFFFLDKFINYLTHFE